MGSCVSVLLSYFLRISMVLNKCNILNLTNILIHDHTWKTLFSIFQSFSGLWFDACMKPKPA